VGRLSLLLRETHDESLTDVTESLSPAISEIMGPDILASRSWLFKVAWRHRSRYHSIRHVISHWCPIETELLSSTVFEISPPNTDTSRKWFLYYYIILYIIYYFVIVYLFIYCYL